MDPNINQINYGLINEEIFTKTLLLLDDKDISMYSTYNEGKSIVAEKFIRTLKGKIYKKWQIMIVNLTLIKISCREYSRNKPEANKHFVK